MILILILIFISVIVFIVYDVFHIPKIIKSEKVEIDEGINAYRAKSLVIQEYNNGVIWATRGYSIYKSTDRGKSFSIYQNLPVRVTSQAFLLKSKLLRQIFDMHDVIELINLRSGTKIIVAAGMIYRYTEDSNRFEMTCTLRLYGRKQGRGITAHGMTEDSEGNIYFGEYGKNPERKSINIYISNDDGITWKLFYTFPDGEIRHVHAVQFDKYENKIWIGTGDGNNASRIGLFSPNDPHFCELFRGDQIYRTVGFLFTRDHVYWGTDSNKIQNRVIRYNRKNNSIESIADLDGPAIYSCKIRDDILVIGTSNLRKKSTSTSIWKSENGTSFERIITQNKNITRKNFAYVKFPRGEGIPHLVFTYFHTQKINNDLLIVNDE